MARDFLAEFTKDEALIYLVYNLVLFHMQPLFVLKDLPFAEIDKMMKYTDVRDIALLGFCDRTGRLGSNSAKEEENRKLFLDKVGF